ncbi:MAG: hypothetical protein A2X96_04685 [Syntrophobacterales bacterium GWC2_56_13]|nr:MAG: hypothetical protein A2X96_04685 [Syntrophobacterales bacterium GWC2_56_13]
MGITIPITPLGVMPIWNSGWGKAFDGFFQIPDNAAFIFDGCDRSSGARYKDENLSLCQS